MTYAILTVLIWALMVACFGVILADAGRKDGTVR